MLFCGRGTHETRAQILVVTLPQLHYEAAGMGGRLSLGVFRLLRSAKCAL